MCRACCNRDILTPLSSLQSGNGKEVIVLEELATSFLISVAASVIGYYICKWLDGLFDDN